MEPSTEYRYSTPIVEYIDIDCRIVLGAERSIVRERSGALGGSARSRESVAERWALDRTNKLKCEVLNHEK